jgi:Cu+-exporting ATPase
VVDPVCGMDIAVEDAAGSHDYRGRKYYFCNPKCLERFSAGPERFLAPGKQAENQPQRSSLAHLPDTPARCIPR